MFWKKLKVLGAGSYGTVSLAAPMDGSSTFAAVKSAEAKDSSSLSMEGGILDALKGSPYVVQCFGEDVSVENGKPTYNLLLEYAAGGTLHDLVDIYSKSKTMLEESQVAYYSFQLLTGISHVHRKGFIHCDLKPSNILVFPTIDHEYDSIVDVRLKLADFGLSLRAVENETHTYWDRGSKKCRHNRGTLLYASPESVACGIHGKAVDIWALGCIVVEMITGRRLWSCCEGIDDLDFKITHEQPVIPSNVSNICKDFLAKCFEKDYNWRWTADMLLTHPFIKSATSSSKYHPKDHGLMISNRVIINPFSQYRRSWVSKQHLFSTCFQVPSNDNFGIFPAENAQSSKLACN
ncbi:mitogen-activated protein kinase kinase kinase 20-like [Nicotiana tomentosiformis]|uniref:mitogen-activated protein kinase kinase kinase 20-like n=1 Tax=Nicotiana tomentosiformis TaxID=4098 RepID=UPI00051C1636|nr:mitogen-activated protein kinase kinase kinase 18-like [Nicotiana tomentosiformis]